MHRHHSSLLVAATAALLLSAPHASAAEAEAGSLTFYNSYADDVRDYFRCDLHPHRWWCGG